MKKNLALIIYLLLFAFSSYAIQNEESDIHKKLIEIMEKNPKYTELGLSYYLEKREIIPQALAWIPKAYIDFDSNLSGVKIEDKSHLIALNSKFGVSQKLPLGANLDLFVKQNNDFMLMKEKSYSYAFATGANLKVPAWFTAPSLLGDYAKMEISLARLQKNRLNINMREQKKLLLIKTISLLTTEKILRERIKLFKKRIFLDEQKNKENEILFRQGKLSALELSKFDKSYKDKKLALFQLESKYCNLVSDLNLIGLDETELSESLDDWLLLLEKYTSDLDFNLSDARSILQLQNRIEWLSQVRAFARNVPQIIFACDFNLIPKEEEYSSFASSIKGFWRDSPIPRWSVSMGFRLNLDPLSKEYRLNKNYKTAKKINKIKVNRLNQELNNIESKKKRELKANNDVLILSKENIDMQKKYLMIAEEIHKQGKISDYDFEMQKCLFAESELSYFTDRYKNIIMKLEYSIFHN